MIDSGRNLSFDNKWSESFWPEPIWTVQESVPTQPTKSIKLMWMQPSMAKEANSIYFYGSVVENAGTFALEDVDGAVGGASLKASPLRCRGLCHQKSI